MSRLEFDKNKELFLWGPIPGRLHYMSMFFYHIYNTIPEKYPHAVWPPTIFLLKNKRMVWINQMEDLIENGIECFQTYMLPKEERSKMYEKWLDSIEKSKDIFRRIEEAEALNDKEFLKLYNEFYEEYGRFWTYSLAPELGNYGSPRLLKSGLKEHIPEDEINSAMESLTAPTEPSFYQLEEFDLAKTDDFEEHAKKYYWLRNSYAGVKESTPEFFRKKKEEISPNIEEEVRSKLNKTEKKKKEIIDKYSLPQEVVRIAKVISDNVVWQDRRKKQIFIRIHYQSLLAKEVSRRTGVSYDNILNLKFSEVPLLFEGREFNFDKRNIIGMDSENKEEYIDSEETKKLWNHYTKTEVVEDTEEVQGTVASKGKAKGKVRIFLDPYEDFEEGDILVTTMTSPEFVFAMKKSSAIVTNTGGITSHAAIVSRELDKPCIVGAKGILEILEDGDMVEVDADEGVVRKLQS